MRVAIAGGGIAGMATGAQRIQAVDFKRAASPKSMQSMSWLFNYHIDWDEPLQAAA